MLKKIISRPIPFFFFLVVLTLLSVFKFVSMPVALYPNATQPTINVVSWQGNMNNQAYYEKYGKIFEDKVLAVSDVESVVAKYWGTYRKWEITYKWDISVEEAKDKTTTLVSDFQTSLPLNLQNLNVRAEGGRSSRVLFSIESETTPSKDIFKFVSDTLEPKLMAVEGAGSVWVSSTEAKSVEITTSYYKLLENGIRPEQLVRLLSSRDSILSLGTHKDSESGEIKTYRLSNTSLSLKEIEEKIVKTVNEKNILLRDIATVKFAQESTSTIFKGNGKRGLIVSASPILGANISQFSSEIIKIAKEQMSSFDDVNVTVLTNPAEFIDAAIKNIIVSLFIGILVATLVIFLFFKSLASTLIIASSIPLSLAGGIAMMGFLNVELNLISLGAMAIAVGMVVDGAIVVFENIMRVKEESQNQSLSFMDYCITGAKDVTAPVIASILTTIIVFTPLLFTAPMARAILGDLASVITLVLCASIFVSCLYVPVITYLLYKNKKGLKERTTIWDKLIKSLKKIYLNTLRKILSSRKISIATLLAFFTSIILGASVIGLFLKKEVIPTPSSKIIILNVNNKLGLTDPEEINQRVIPIEKKLESILKEELSTYQTIISSNWIGIFITLKSSDLVEIANKKLETNFVTDLSFSYRLRPFNPTQLKIPDPADLTINFPANIAAEEILKIEENLRGKVKDFPGTTLAAPNSTAPSTEYDVVFNKNFDYLSVEAKSALRDQIPQIIRTLNIDNALNQVIINGDEYDVRIKFLEKDKGGFDFKDLPINVNGSYVPLRNYIDIVPKKIPGQISYKDGTIDSFIEVRFSEGMTIEKMKDITAETYPDLFPSLVFKDGQTEINENLSSLYLALGISIIGVFFVILTQFNGIKDGLIVLAAVPLCFFGVGAALWGFDQTLSMNTLLGIILLSGISVNNSIIFLDFYRKSQSDSNAETSQMEAIINTANVRFRPILITTLTTIIGMLPIAFGFGEGGDVLRSLGITVAVGLGWSAVLTMLAIPILLNLTRRKES